MTKKEMFNHIATLNADDTEVVDFCNKEIERLEKRSSSKAPTKTQKENEGVMDSIAEALTAFSEGVTVTDLIASSEALTGLTNQKVSALLRKMIEAGRVTKSMKGKKAFFTLA